ncbi:MAG: hypothetical protein Q7R41_14820 [Phycisphaerales bacterium]|nr:hypothetical protein [Phycisphaerales bacterium]
MVAIEGGVPIALPQCPHLFVVEKLFAVGPSIFAQGLARDGRGGAGLAPGVTGWDTAFAPPKRLTTPAGHFVNDIVFDHENSKAYGVFSPTPHSVSVGAWDLTAGGLVWSKDLSDGVPIPLLAVVPSPDDIVDWDPPPANIGLSAGKIVIFRQLTDARGVAVVDRESFAVTAVALKDADDGTTPTALQFTPMAKVPQAFVLVGGELRVASLVTGAIAPAVLEAKDLRPFDILEARAAMQPFPLGDGFVAPYRKELLVQPSVFHPLFGLPGLEDLRRAHEIAIHPDKQGPIVLSERGRQAIGIDI